jgi:hypothetical protein
LRKKTKGGNVRHGSQQGHRYIRRNRTDGHSQMLRDYFVDNLVTTFSGDIFRMSRDLFLRIVTVVEEHDDWFKQRRDACGQLSSSAMQKCTAAMRVLGYGIPGDFIDEYVRIA